MTLEELRKIRNPQTLSNDLLKAIWQELHNNWEAAHRIVQAMSTSQAQWLHAYLHRKEGDISNSQYWYRRVGKSYPHQLDFEQELQAILEDA